MNKTHFAYLSNPSAGYLLDYYPNSNLFLNLLQISLQFHESISTIMVWDLFFKQCGLKFWSGYTMRSLSFTRWLLVTTKPFQWISWLQLSQHNVMHKSHLVIFTCINICGLKKKSFWQNQVLCIPFISTYVTEVEEPLGGERWGCRDKYPWG